jgi:hypothetical protein
VNLDGLQRRIAAQVIVRDDPEYRHAWGNTWNQLRPERYPDASFKLQVTWM